MKKVINGSITFLLLSMLVACTDEKDDYARIHSNLLPSEGHTYSLQAVGKEITFDLLEENNITNVGPIRNEASYKSMNEQYPKLELQKEPAFIVFDENGLVLKTYDYKEMIDFLQNPED
ncbi:hypothetical protein ACPOM7_25525 [Peribacillus castrilensis]|uniref:Lipoprotein n=1 Tax=Peribacillus simplex TaxID=1478 RepID=A0AAN2TV63_9BACI|nr:MULTISPECIES: hypothetical protein [Bacillaceae]MCP1096738.1 hypothetical protein [Bacillaceae bacterium OS4b]MBD8590358.1 hypothetical protein [Peribacillus simplex]MCF7624851.1 hypothetical protein [Peribacillus frigoritolerans]MEA3577379.1 hypothetical protein [Peribacillus frigoritolerans]PRA89479.1 hypothetical protein CQ056_12810 [Peribacillus simplex]